MCARQFHPKPSKVIEWEFRENHQVFRRVQIGTERARRRADAASAAAANEEVFRVDSSARVKRERTGSADASGFLPGY